MPTPCGERPPADCVTIRAMTEDSSMTPDDYCQEKAAASGSSFYYSFLFLPPERRRAISEGADRLGAGSQRRADCGRA